SRAPSRVAGRCPTTPISWRTRSRPPRRATRPTWSARFVRWNLAPTARSCQPTPHGGGQLGHRDRPFELRLDPAVGADQEDPRLRRQVPLSHLLVPPERRVVVLVDLDVDEADPACAEAPAHGLHDVDDGPARPARAELRRREDDDE